MNKLIIRRLAAFDRIVDFGANHALTPALPAAAALYTQMGTIADDLRGHAGDQDGGRGEFLGGSAVRLQVADGLLDQMRPINRITRSMDPEQYPGLREKFRMPKSANYEKLIARAQAFLDALAPVKSVLVARGLPADFDEQLSSKKDELVAATDRKNTGNAQQVGGTASLLAKSKEGMQSLQELDAILSYQYRNDPDLLAGWKAACHVERTPRSRKKASGTAAAPATAAPSPAAPAPAA
jgi:hypothetical protein